MRVLLTGTDIHVLFIAWAVYFVTRNCFFRSNVVDEDSSGEGNAHKPTIVRVNSAEILVMSSKNPVNNPNTAC